MFCFFLFLFSTAHAIDIVQGGQDPTQETPPDSNVPTVGTAPCPVGYSCIPNEGALAQTLQTGIDSLNEKNDLLDAIVNRLDSKLTQSEEEKVATLETLQDSLEALKEAQQQQLAQETELNRVRGQYTEILVKLEEQNQTQFLMYILIFFATILIFAYLERLRPHLYFLWEVFKERWPTKLPW